MNMNNMPHPTPHRIRRIMIEEFKQEVGRNPTPKELDVFMLTAVLFDNEKWGTLRRFHLRGKVYIAADNYHTPNPFLTPDPDGVGQRWMFWAWKINAFEQQAKGRYGCESWHRENVSDEYRRSEFLEHVHHVEVARLRADTEAKVVERIAKEGELREREILEGVRVHQAKELCVLQGQVNTLDFETQLLSKDLDQATYALEEALSAGGAAHDGDDCSMAETMVLGGATQSADDTGVRGVDVQEGSRPAEETAGPEEVEAMHYVDDVVFVVPRTMFGSNMATIEFQRRMNVLVRSGLRDSGGIANQSADLG